MNKMQIAHDWFITSINNGKHVTIEQAWCYADAMQAEADKRECKDRPESLCEVDWSVAPCWAREWVMRDGVAKWQYGAYANSWEYAPSFGFTGTHIVERPQ